MDFTDDEKNTGKSGEQPPCSGPVSAQDIARSLDEITHLLRRMLALAELSASDLPVDRQLLQRSLDRHRAEVERIADSIDL